MREIYHALIYSYLRYGIIAWGKTTKTNLQKVQVLINRAVRIMSFAPFGRIDLDPLYEILEILKIEHVYELEIAKFAFRRQRNLLPCDIANYFQVREPTRTLRNCLLTQPSRKVITNTILGAKSVERKSSEIWEKVPNEIKLAPSLNSFKKIFKSHLILTNYLS